MTQLLERYVRVEGRVLDLGSGPAPSYRTELRGTPHRYVSIDASTAHAPDAVVDLERDRLPFAEHSFETVLAFNLLEHVYAHDHTLAEARRVLCPRGMLFVWVPFLVGYHPDPDDFYRYSESSLRRKLSATGYEDARVVAVGGRFTASANLALGGIPGSAPKALVAAAAVLADRLYYRMARTSKPSAFPLGYLAAARRIA